MKFRIFGIAFAALLFSVSIYAQVPALLNYQGRIVVGSTNFEGTGQFKFALVGPDFNMSQQATAIASVGGLDQRINFIQVQMQGNGYMTAPTVTITDSTGTGATAEAIVSFGQVTGILVTNGGSGYSILPPTQGGGPTVTIAPPPPNIFTQRFWSNDGVGPQPLPGQSLEPATVVSLPVTKGLYSVLLGDSTILNMADIPTQIFSYNQNVRLRVWFNDGTNGFHVLSPDQRLAPTAYLADGAVTNQTIADGAIYGAKVSPGSITATQIANGAVGATQLAAPLNNATVGEENLRLLRGTFVNGIGLNLGTGFTIGTNAPGDYTINFSTPFPFVPSVSVTPRTRSILVLGVFIGYQRYTCNIVEVATDHARVIIMSSAAGTGTPPTEIATLIAHPFDFVVVGPR